MPLYFSPQLVIEAPHIDTETVVRQYVVYISSARTPTLITTVGRIIATRFLVNPGNHNITSQQMSIELRTTQPGNAFSCIRIYHILQCSTLQSNSELLFSRSSHN